MKCDADGCQNDATVSETVIRAGQRVERHLCDECARKQGIAVQSHPPISEMLTKFVMQQVAAQEVKQERQEKALACPACATTWAKFRQGGLLGCPSCYEAFDSVLSPLIERAQEGNQRHTGKAPRRGATDPVSRARSAAAVRRELADAVQTEQYERAARLRDELRSLGADDSGPEEPRR